MWFRLRGFLLTRGMLSGELIMDWGFKMDIHWETIWITIIGIGLVVGFFILFVVSLLRFKKNTRIHQQTTLKKLSNLEQKVDKLIDLNEGLPRK